MARRPTTLLVAVLAVLAAGCGGDGERAETTPEPPELTVPGEGATEQPADTGTTTEPGPTTSPPAEAPAPGSEAPKRRAAPDSPQNDVPPPAGSPAERFERFCEQNPGACG